MSRSGGGVRYDRESVEFARAFTFFDAGYAIALTLLVVNLDPPDASDWNDLGTWLATGLYWQIFGFVLSFAVIAVFWRVNHRIGGDLEAVDSRVITANIVALGFVVLVPFSTQGISDPETVEAPLAVAVYAVNLSAAVVAQSTVQVVARRHGLLRRPVPARIERIRLLDTMTTPAVFLASIPVAYAFGADWGRLTWALLLVIGPLSGRITARRIAAITAAGSEEAPAGPAAPLP